MGSDQERDDPDIISLVELSDAVNNVMAEIDELMRRIDIIDTVNGLKPQRETRTFDEQLRRNAATAVLQAHVDMIDPLNREVATFHDSLVEALKGLNALVAQSNDLVQRGRNVLRDAAPAIQELEGILGITVETYRNLEPKGSKVTWSTDKLGRITGSIKGAS